MTTRLVLVVDDEPEICNLLRKFLTLSGFEVSCAHDGEEAKRYMADKPYEAVLCDMNMPLLHGSELLSQLHAEYPDTPIIAMSGSIANHEIREALENGAVDFIAKPFGSLVDVVGALERYTQGEASSEPSR